MTAILIMVTVLPTAAMAMPQCIMLQPLFTMCRVAIGKRNRSGYGTSQRYWVDQYYDKSRDVWVLGHWEERLGTGTPGYWTHRQVWVTP